MQTAVMPYDNGRRICQHESQTFIYLSCNFARTSPVVDYDCHEELIFVLLFDIYAADHRSIVKNFGFCNFLASIICLRSCIFSVSWRPRPSQSLVFYFFSFFYFSLFSKRKKYRNRLCADAQDETRFARRTGIFWKLSIWAQQELWQNQMDGIPPTKIFITKIWFV